MCRVLASAAARDVIREAEMDRTTLAATLRARVRYDGLWWRKFAYLGCVYGPDWWKRYSPPWFAWAIFLLIGKNREGAIVNMQRVLGERERRRAIRAALGMYAEFAHCMTETMEHY